jgi:amino acid adenylation domain-containing protein
MDLQRGIPFVHEWFHATAQTYSQEPAIDSAMGRVSYRDLDLNSDSLAASLLSAGVRQGDCVAIFTEDRIGLIIGCLGTLKAGGAFIPISPDLPGKRIEQMLEAAPPAIILADRSLEERLTKILPAGVSAVILYWDVSKLPAPPAQPRFPQPQSNNLSYIFFSSGSTGTPKAIAGKLESIGHFIQWEINTLRLKKGVRVSQLISPSFDAFLRDIFVPLCCGGTVCIPFSNNLLRDGLGLLQWIESQNIELVHCVPSLFRMLLDHIKPGDLTSLKHILLSGEALLPSDVRRWRSVMGDRVQLVNLYGPSETTMTKFAYFVTASDADKPSVAIGRPIQGTAAMILDDALNPCPQGVIGEIYIRTRYRTLGYYCRPDLTKQVFIPNPFGADPDDVIYKTGDYGRVREDDNFEFLGRRDRQVKIRGARIELDEVEKVIREIPNIAEAAVVDREVDPGNKLLYAYLVLRNGPLSQSEKDMIALSLPGYMLPDVYMELESLPRTDTGKVDYRNLPLPDERFKKKEYEKPQTPVQEIIAGIWKEVLGHSKIGLNEDFFEIGGHSLLATRVITRVRRVFGIEMPLHHLFAGRTIRGLARRVEELRLTIRRHPAPHIVPARRGNEIPLSFAQERLWFIEQLRPGLMANQVFFNRRLKGKLDRSALRQSLNGIIRRHEILRTRLRLGANGPIQEIVADPAIDLKVIDLTLLDAEKCESWARRLARRHDELPFNLATGLLRATLLVLSDKDHVLLLKTHHIVSDGWSVDILARELSAFYSAACSGAAVLLPELPIQYADFAIWQRNWLQGAVLEEHLTYWKKQLEGLPVLELATDHARTFPPDDRAGHVSFELSAAMHDQVKAFCHREGATMFMVLMAIFQIMMGRHARQQDVAVGTDSANRGSIETEGLIGFFVNPLVIRGLLRPLANFRQLVAQLRECVLDAYSHENLPFEKLVEEISPDRNTGRHPLFQVVFAMKNATPAGSSFPGLQIEPFEGGTSGINVDLSLMVGEKDGALEASFEYAQGLFERVTIQRMAGHFRTLLESALTAPERSIGSLPMLTDTEHEELVFGTNVGHTREIPNLTVWQLFERQAVTSPDRPAAVCEGQRLSYRELRSTVNALATQLHKMVSGPDQCVGVCCQRGTNTLIALLAILKCRASYLPLDPSLPDSRLAYMVTEAQPSVVIATKEFLGRDGLRRVRTLCPEQLEMHLEHGSDEVWEDAKDNTASYLIYTSGSTGSPKGAVVEQHGMLNHLLAKIEELQIDDKSIVAQTASVAFDISIWQFIAPLLAGGTVHIFSDEVARDGLRILTEVDSTGVTILETVPSLLGVMIEEQETSAGKHLALSNLRVLLSTGEALPLDLCRRWKKLFPAVRLVNAYGPTECSDDVTHYEIDGTEYHEQRSAYAPIGRPLRNTRLYVLDEWLQAVPTGVVGELYVGGAGVGRGYLNRPQLTAQMFQPDCFGPEAGGRLYRTGDLARWLPGGMVDFIGRVDQQFKISGQRLELGEIEAVLGDHPKVREARVIVNQKDSSGPRLVAYVVLDKSGSNRPGEPGELIRYLKSKLPKYMVPDVVMPLPCMPLNINGKLDYGALPVPEFLRAEEQQDYVAPSGPLEELLCGVWEDLLKVPRVGVNDNIFDIGGHSLLAMQAVARIRSLLGIDLPLTYIFDAPSIGELAQAISSLEKAPGQAQRKARAVMKLKNMSQADKEILLAKISTASAATT